MRAFVSWQAFLVGALALSALPVFGAGRERTGPDSFLPYRAYTVDALVAQVENDAVVRQRLAKHFHVPQAELVAYLRDNIEVVNFSSSGWRPIYGVTSTGRIYRSRDYFREGGKVFGTADGTPVLKYACGNPVTAELPAAGPQRVEMPPPQVEMAPPHSPEEYAVTMGLPMAPTFEIPSAVPVEVPQEQILVAEVPFTSTFEVPPAQLVGGRGVFMWPLLAVPLLHTPTPPPIPEPGSIVLLGSGLAALGASLLRRRKPQA